MSPTRRDIIKAAGALTAAIAMGPVATLIEPAIAEEPLHMEYLFVGAQRGNDRYSILGTTFKAPEFHEFVTLDSGRCVTLSHPLSPKGQRLWNDCLAQMAAVFTMEEAEEGWD